MRVRLSRQAADDIADIIAYTVQQFGETQAKRYSAGLHISFELLEDNPRLGHAVLRSNRAGEFRRYTYKSHYIFYEIQSTEIVIATIRNTRQRSPED